VCAQRLDRFVRERGLTPAKLAPQLRGEVAREQHNVFAALAQRGNGDGEDGEAEVEVSSELAALGCGLQVSVRGGNDAHVNGDGRASSYSVNDLLLNGAKKFPLRPDGQLSNLV
jgi:hypothetical protein